MAPLSDSSVPALPRVAVIGAGCSGLAAVKNLVQAGIRDVVCFEAQDGVGGNWVYNAREGHSSVFETTHIISSKAMSEFLDFPMPDDYPDYPSHRQVLAYFQAYADRFGLLPYIRFRTKVLQASKQDGGAWLLRLDDGSEERFDFLLVANGHHSVPLHPEWKDAFTGRYLHAHAFKNNQGFEGSRVLVVGAGNSGCDCASEISRVAAFTALSVRTPQYIIPKFIMGKPTDVFNRRLAWAPDLLMRPLRKLALRLQVGRYEDYGLETPRHDIVQAHPTVNSELLDKIRHGDVHPRRGVVSVEGRTVTFADGRREEYDTIVAATGYRLATPFFDPRFLDFSEADRLPLYLRMFHPDHPTLVFIGLVQPQGAIWPLSDRQARLAANYIAGRWQLPSDLRALAEKEADRIARDFLPRKRHVVEVHYSAYSRELERQWPKEAPAWEDRLEAVSL